MLSRETELWFRAFGFERSLSTAESLYIMDMDHHHQQQQQQQRQQSANTAAPTQQQNLPLDAVITPFLKKLLTVTSALPPNIGGWDDKGMVFVILDGPGFEVILRNYFKGTLQTFIRQLHFYGFSKSDLPRLGPHAWSFSHPCFLKDSPNLVAEIKRKSHGHHPPTMSPSLFSSKKGQHSSQSSLEGFRLDQEAEAELNEINELKQRLKSLQETLDLLVKFVGVKLEDGTLTGINANKRRKLVSVLSECSEKTFDSSSGFDNDRERADPVSKITKKMSEFSVSSMNSFTKKFSESTFSDLPLEDVVSPTGTSGSGPVSTGANSKLRRIGSSLVFFNDAADPNDETQVL